MVYVDRGLIIDFRINPSILRLVSFVLDEILIGDKFLQYANIPNNISFHLRILNSLPTGTNLLLPATGDPLGLPTNTGRLLFLLLLMNNLIEIFLEELFFHWVEHF